MKPEDDPEFMELVEECILDLSSAELNICEIISKDLGVDPVVEALRPSYEGLQCTPANQDNSTTFGPSPLV